MRKSMIVKSLVIPVSVGLFAFAGRYHQTQIALKADHPMAFAINAKGQILDSASVDLMGNYHFTKLPNGTYNILVKIPGESDLKISGVEHMGNNFSYHVAIQTPGIGNFGISNRRTSFIDGLAKSIPSSAREMSTGGVAMRGSRVDASSSTMEGGFMSAGGSSREGSSSIKAGQITAGNWRDLDNWDKWNETNKEASIAEYQKTWGFNTQNRFAVQFFDSKNNPIIGARVELTDQHKTKYWQTVTDNLGHAELWANMFSIADSKEIINYKIVVAIQEKNYDFKVKPFSGSADVFNLPIISTVDAVADVAFVVEATGSMGDEISYLQSELLDVATRVKKNNTCLKLNLGSVFYKDHGDEYVTIKSDFSENITQVANFIFDQSAGGGGDFPEAVDDAMETAIDGLKWSDNAIAKIMFLVLDAPPHESAENKAKVRKYTEKAVQKGIKIIPIVASGINQSTEFLMKYMAIATNGNYVYITDHSGIGNAHEKPTGVKENMQYLNDLMVDIISENTKWNGCKDQTQTPDPNKPGTVEIVTNGQWQVQVYPNPAVDKIMIKSNEVMDEIAIYDLRGNLVQKVQQISPEKNTIELNNVSTGVYIVRCKKGEKIISCRILVIK